jgi:hypothetical protein
MAGDQGNLQKSSNTHVHAAYPYTQHRIYLVVRGYKEVKRMQPVQVQWTVYDTKGHFVDRHKTRNTTD